VRILRYIALFVGAPVRALSLFPLIISSLLVAVLLVGSGTTLAHPGFQSPLSPIGSPTATPPAVSPQPTVEPPTTTPAEAPSPPPTESPEGPPSEAPSPLPAESPEGPPTEVPGEAATPTEQVQVSPAPATPAGSEESSVSVRRLSWATLIDAFIVGVSSLWLCCGSIVLVLFVLGMIVAFVQRPER
jgi:hypothetical protein